MHRLRGKAWREMRAHVLARDGHSCTVAEYDRGVLCTPGPLHVHEIDEDADADDPDTYAAVCAAHHARWHALRRGTIRPHKERLVA
jgi:hypothetical protein